MATGSTSAPTAPPAVALGRYEIIGTLGRGGMAAVYLGRHSGEAGFQRLFAIKVLHPHLAAEAGFVEMLLDEARIAALLHHPNVVPIVDLGSHEGFHYVVMDYIEGCSLSALLGKYRDSRPPEMIIPIVLDALAGLHAAHTLTDEAANPLRLVHRDFSPQNVLVGIDGAARITDFGVAKAESRTRSTRPGQLKGKLAYMPPEQVLNGSTVDCRADIFSAGAVLWSALTGKRLFLGDDEGQTIDNILHLEVAPPSTVGLRPPSVFDAVALRALERDPSKRFASAAEMEDALRAAASQVGAIATKRALAEWVTAAVGTDLTARRAGLKAAAGAKRETTIGSQSQVSGFRTVPHVAHDMHAGASPAESACSLDEVLDPNLETRADDVAQPQPQPRRRLFGVPAILALVGVAIFLLSQRTRGAFAHDDNGAALAALSASLPVASVTPPVASVDPTPVVAAPLAAASAAAAAVAALETPASRQAPATTPSRTSENARTPTWSAHVSSPKPKPPTASTEGPKKKTWDIDSPRPPQ